MHAEFSYAHFAWLLIVHTHHCTEKSRNLWNRVQEKKVALFVNRPLALQYMTLKYRHKKSMHTMVAPGSPIEQKCHFFFSSTLLNKTDVLIIQIIINCKEWPLKMCVRTFLMHYILNEQFWLYISRVISKSVRRELTVLVECIYA